MSERLVVDLGDRSYPIEIGADLAAQVLALLEKCTQAGQAVSILTDENVAQSQAAFFDRIQSAYPQVNVLSLKAGEPTKSVQSLEAVYDWLAASKVDRHGILMAVGGGVIGDLAGFAAASYLRGIDFVQMPTTLLSMVDSSVGGKTGINLKAGKNLVGAFYQPQSVFIDMGLLQTLPDREFSAGMAEVIKYGMLYDRALFDELTQLDRLHASHEALPKIIRRCCEIKAEIVKADERETAKSGGRALLNLGHTFAHGIENVAGYGEYLHGEAVGVGLVMAAKLSEHLGHIGPEEVSSVESLVTAYQLPTKLRQPLKISALMEAMMRDKKVRAGKLRFVAMEAIGKAVTVGDISEDVVVEMWKAFGAE